MKILVIDTIGLQLGYLGCYGNEWIATPNIDRLAAEGITFDQHFVHTPATGPGVAGWLECARESSNDLDRSDGIVRLQPASLAAPWDLADDLLTAYTEEDEVDPWPDPPPGELTNEDDVLRAQDTYAAAVTWFDAQLGRLLDDIDKRSWADQLLLVLTSSAGYPLGEHGRLGWDRPWLHEEVVHVPLIVRCPGRRFAGLRIAAITQPSDLTAALEMWAPLSAGDLGAAAGLPGLIQGNTESLRPHALTSWQIGERSESALRSAEWALIIAGLQQMDDPPRPRQLYIKPDDRWEVNNIAERDHETADELERTLRDSLRS